MSAIVTDAEWVGPWVAGKIGGAYHPGTVAIGLTDSADGLQAGVLYENWNGRSIVAHIAVEGRMTPSYLAAIFDYPYNVAGVEKIICPVAECHYRSAALAEKMGFREEARIEDAHSDGAIRFYTLRRGDCRFLSEKYGAKISAAKVGV